MKVELRIAKIVGCRPCRRRREADPPVARHRRRDARQVFAGIKSAYDPAALVGRLTVMVANLAPRKMKFGMSEGMVLAASGGDDKTGGIYILSPDSGALPGMRKAVSAFDKKKPGSGRNSPGASSPGAWWTWSVSPFLGRHRALHPRSGRHLQNFPGNGAEAAVMIAVGGGIMVHAAGNILREMMKQPHLLDQIDDKN